MRRRRRLQRGGHGAAIFDCMIPCSEKKKKAFFVAALAGASACQQTLARLALILTIVFPGLGKRDLFDLPVYSL